MYARTDLELIARHHQTERRNEATATRRSRKLQDFTPTQVYLTH